MEIDSINCLITQNFAQDARQLNLMRNSAQIEAEDGKILKLTAEVVPVNITGNGVKKIRVNPSERRIFGNPISIEEIRRAAGTCRPAAY